MDFVDRKPVIIWTLVLLACFVGFVFLYQLFPANSSGNSIVFQINNGDGFRTVVKNLYNDGLIRSKVMFEIFATFDGEALHVEPGLYRLSPTMTGFAIVHAISGGAHVATVTIPEGTNVFEIDRILSNALVIRSGELVSLNTSSSLEGKLFPDTYQFFTGSPVDDVVDKMKTDFNEKAAPLLATDQKNADRDLIVASLVEKEVASSTDRAIVAGILLKRIAAHMELNVDATICYAKDVASSSAVNCYPITINDLNINSPYNTYRYPGLPPTPIGNPGADAIKAVLHPQSSPYWYYLSDPATGKTIYAATLAQQNANRAKYIH